MQCFNLKVIKIFPSEVPDFMVIDQFYAALLSCSSYLTDHVRSASWSVFVWLAGWADSLHVSTDASAAPDQSPKAGLWGHILKGREGPKSGVSSAEQGCLVCMQDGG